MKVNVLGYGLMAKQIAALFYLGGHNVTIWNHRTVDENEIKRQIKLLNKFLESDTSGEIHIVDKLEDLEDSLTIESVIEDLEVKTQLFIRLSGKITLGYLTNSSSFSPVEIGAAVGGLHFFNPIAMKIVECYKPEGFYSSELDQAILFLESTGFEIIQVNANRGYVGNYILFNEISSALKLIEKNNYSVHQINSLYAKLYQGRNIFSIIDLVGIDVVNKILINLKEADDTIYLPNCLGTALDQNILGKKNRTTITSVLAGIN